MALAEVCDAPPSAEPDRSEHREPPARAPEVLPEAPPAQEGASAPASSTRAESVTPIRLIGVQGEADGREWTFPAAFLVGRVAGAGLIFTDSVSGVSRAHAHVWHQGGEWWVADLASTNGTYFNGTRIGLAPVGPLRPGDMVQFGRIALRVGRALRPARSWAELSLPSPWSATETIRVRAPNRAGPLTVYPSSTRRRAGSITPCPTRRWPAAG